MTDSELRAVIARLRRSTRNADVLDICDALEARLATAALASQATQSNTLDKPLDKAPFDKKTYQRDLMRKRRADEKRKKQQTNADPQKS